MCSFSTLRIQDVGQSVSSQSKMKTVRRFGKEPGKGMRCVGTYFGLVHPLSFLSTALLLSNLSRERNINCTAACLFSGEWHVGPPERYLEASFTPFLCFRLCGTAASGLVDVAFSATVATGPSDAAFAAAFEPPSSSCLTLSVRSIPRRAFSPDFPNLADAVELDDVGR